MSAMVAAEQLVDEGAVHLVCPFGGRLMLEFHRVTRCPTWAAEASPCAGTSMPCNPIVPEVPFGGELLSVISPLLPLGEVDDEGSISTLWTRKGNFIEWIKSGSSVSVALRRQQR